MLAGPTLPEHGPRQAMYDGHGRAEQPRLEEVLRAMMEGGNVGFQDGLRAVAAQLGQVAQRQEDMETRWAEQTRWNREVKEDVDRQRLLIEAQQSILLDEHNLSVLRSVEYDEYQGFREIEDEGDDDDAFDSGPEYEEPDDRTFDPASVSESEEEEYELLQPKVEGSGPSPNSTPAGRKRRARAQPTSSSPSPSHRRPPWVRRETAIPNPHLARIAQDLAQRRAAAGGRKGSGAGTISDPVVLD
ncbi:hypothetical protein MFIFM68171_07621 [Madurella fahalii]|uniref:Uncharacterized protein n=1 Tax=Madurella fahalii TaxID=1157608 RepID=A0ABQ0GI23_9PEZI